MKKLTAFFMALMPLLVTILLFAAGLIVKNSTHVYVQSVSMNYDSLPIHRPDDSKEKEFQLQCNVLPTNATNPELIWTSSDDKVAVVDNTGKIKTTGYGEAYVYAISKENPTISTKCKVEVWDDRIHQIEIGNAYYAEQLGYSQTLKIEPKFIPSTHLKDKTVKYTTADESLVKVAPDGTMRACDDKSGTTTITVETTNQKPAVTKQFNVKVTPGVIQLDIKDKTQAILSNKTYDFKKEIMSYPDKETKSNDFIYNVSDDSVASIDEKGVVHFHKAGEVLVTAKYRRNEDLVVAKSIKSTFDAVEEVYFNRYEFKDTLSNYTSNKELPISYSTFPTQIDNQKVKFESSNPDVVTPVYENNKWVFKANGAGTAVLKASIQTSTGITEEDYCLVSLTSTDIEGKIFKQSTVDSKSYYYSLRDNLNMDLYSTLSSPEWTISTDDNRASINPTNLVVHATKNIPCTVILKTGGKEYKFVINFNNTIADLPIDQETFKIQVGQKYQFKDCYLRSLEMTDEAFNKETSGLLLENIYTFIPKKGGIYNATLHDGSLFGKSIQLLVEEKPLDISLKETNPHIVTVDSTLNVSDKFAPTVIPSSATKDDGTGCAIKYDYVLEQQVVKQENNVLTFLQSATAGVKMSVNDNIYKNVTIHSTCGDVGKFTLKNDDGKEIASGETIQIAKGQTKTISLNSVLTDVAISGEIVKQFEIEPKNIYKEEVESSIVWNASTNTIDFNIKPTKEGLVNIAIKSGTFTFLLNINVSAEVEKIALYHQAKPLSSDSNIAAFSNQFTLDVITEPISADASNVKYSITKEGGSEGELKQIPDTRKITIDSASMPSYGLYTIKLQATNSLGTTITSIYKIEYKEKLQASDVIIPEADKDNKIYIESVATQLISTISVNAIVDSNFYNDFKVKFGDTEGQIIFNKIYFDKIPAPTDDNPGYESDITLTYSKGTNTFEKKLHVSRDIVSRIVLPNHDNLDMTDKKGLQKVHVYGNKSYIDGKILDYYKLPIDLYDFKREKIVDPVSKEKAYNSLNVSFSDNKSNAKYVNGYLEVRFANESLYAQKEINDNAFDVENAAKNIKINIDTKSKTANANYTFVAVDGLNVYDQQGIKITGREIPIVLQTNFGTPNGADFNDKSMVTAGYAMVFSGFYGNGYEVHLRNFCDYVTNKILCIHFEFAINTILSGFNDDEVSWSKYKDISLYTNTDFFEHYFRYTIFKNMNRGLNPKLQKKNYYIKNCIFYNIMLSSIINDGDQCIANTYIEDCTFFNSGCFTFWFGLRNPEESAKLFFKGDIRLYNFHNKEIFEHFGDFDISAIAWEPLLAVARSKNMLQVGADGREYVNSFMLTYLDEDIYFWNGTEYIKSTQGFEGNSKYLSKCIDLKLPMFKNIELSIWLTISKNIMPNAPSYYDEYDKDGNIRQDFLAKQIELWSRKPNYF